MKPWLFALSFLFLSSLIDPGTFQLSTRTIASVCVNPTETICVNNPENSARFDAVSKRVTGRAFAALGIQDIPYEATKNRALAAQIYGAIEKEIFTEINLKRTDLDYRFSLIRDTLMQMIHENEQIPPQMKEVMFARLQVAKLLTISEIQNDTRVRVNPWECGLQGLDQNSFTGNQLSEFSEVVICPGMLLNYRTEAALDINLAHELGHLIDSHRFGIYGDYLQCLSQTLGIPKPPHTFEIEADYWAMTVLERIHQNSDFVKLQLTLSESLQNLCYQSSHHDPVWGADHFPTAARYMQSIVFHPTLRARLGCPAFSKANPGCGLSGVTPR